MGLKTLSDINVKGRRVLLRADLNAPISDGIITDANRLNKIKPTIDYLLNHNASIVLCSHLGRPKGIGYEAQFSMAPIAEWLKKQDLDVTLASDVTGKKVEAEAASLKARQILLLENLRFDKREIENDPEFINELANLADVYINDAFSTAHRTHASISGVAMKFNPSRAAIGFLMEEELAATRKVINDHERPLLVIMGGSKVSEKIGVIRNFLGKADTILIGGAMSFTFLKAMGFEIGSSLYEEDKLQLAKDLQADAEAAGTKLILPLDHVIASEVSATAECSITQDQFIPVGKMGLDIGPETVVAYIEEIRKAQTILWNGPMGVFEIDPFATGTIAIAEEAAKSAQRGNFVLIGGGDSVTAATKAGVTDLMSYVSTGGGASLELLSGIELPGLTAIKPKQPKRITNNKPLTVGVTELMSYVSTSCGTELELLNNVELPSLTTIKAKKIKRAISNQPPKMVIANWKMNHLRRDAIDFCMKFKASYQPVKGLVAAIAPPLTLLSGLSEVLNDILPLYGQNAHAEPNGAFTGEVSMAQIQDAGASGVILGHSERRQHFFETNETLSRKIKAAWKHGLMSVLCIGETMTQLDEGSTFDSIQNQLSILSNLACGPLTIAYEPTWTIGTNRRASADQIENVHNFIRSKLINLLGARGYEVPILYGGGVNPDNFMDILGIPEVSGCLVGGASLDADKFLQLIAQIQDKL